jgi:hypothetical protein
MSMTKLQSTVLVLGGICAASAAPLACGSSSQGSGEQSSAAGGASFSSGGSGGAGGSTSSTSAQSAVASSSSSSGCPSTPMLFADPATLEYCLYDAMQTSLYCTLPAEVCCLGASHTSICAVAGTTCPTPLVTLNCTGAAQCGAGQVCCASGPEPTLDVACGFFTEEGMPGSSCVTGTSCPSGLFELCGSTADCATCTAFKHSSGDDLGFCN